MSEIEQGSSLLFRTCHVGSRCQFNLRSVLRMWKSGNYPAYFCSLKHIQESLISNKEDWIMSCEGNTESMYQTLIFSLQY